MLLVRLNFYACLILSLSLFSNLSTLVRKLFNINNIRTSVAELFPLFYMYKIINIKNVNLHPYHLVLVRVQKVHNFHYGSYAFLHI